LVEKTEGKFPPSFRLIGMLKTRQVDNVSSLTNNALSVSIFF